VASRIFLSYRREDTAAYTGRIFDALVEVFGEPAVFMDIDTIAPGQDFVQVIDDTLVRCEVALVIIGPNWLHSTDKKGSQRLFNDDDFVRMEIEGALTHNVRVLPVLVGGASMPAAAELPPSIATLSRRHAFEMSDRRWHSDMRDLVAALQRSTIPAASTPPPPEPPSALYKPLPPLPPPPQQRVQTPAWTQAPPAPYSAPQATPARYSAPPPAKSALPPPPPGRSNSTRIVLIVGAVAVVLVIVIYLYVQSQLNAGTG